MRGIREGREDVYLVREKRIRFHRQTYTVLLAIFIRLDEKGYAFGPCNR